MSMSREGGPRIRVLIAWSGINNRINKVMPCGYAYTIPALEGDAVHWGRGGERDCQALLSDIVERLVDLKFTSGENDWKFTLVVNGTGVKLYFNEHTLTWMKKTWRQGKKRRPAWTRAKLLSEVAGIDIDAPTTEERKALERLREIALEKAKEAEARKEHVSEGVKRRDDDSADEPNVA